VLVVHNPDLLALLVLGTIKNLLILGTVKNLLILGTIHFLDFKDYKKSFYFWGL